MKRIFTCLLALILVTASMSVLSCARGNDADDSGADQPARPEQITVADLTIAGNALSQYKIVYAPTEFSKLGPKIFTTEYSFYKLTASDIQKKIFEITGVELPLAPDTSTEEGQYEILVGPTNRAESDVYDDMDVYSYENSVKNGKLVIGGGYDASYLTGNTKTSYCHAATYHSFDAVLEYIKDAMSSGVSEIDLAEGFVREGKADLTTVACIGDSITEGDKAIDWNQTSYPAVLQRYLWKDYVVINYGKCGKTMRFDMDRRYDTTVQYQTVKRYASKIDIALIMLGTNDFLNDASFSAADDKSFNDSALKLVDVLTSKNEDVKVTVMNCPAYYGSNTVTYKHVRDMQYDLVGTLADKGVDVSFFDMYTFTNSTLTSSRYPDQLHPNDEGYALIAEKLSTVVPQIKDGTYSEE